jgi:arylsulfatase A-like enzyme
MSLAYSQACRRLDDNLGALVATIDGDPDTLLIALADHGGGGRVANDHDSSHALDRTIPLILAGSGVVRGPLGRCTLLDVPPTILFALGLDVPDCLEGRVLDEAFERRCSPAAAVA